MLQKLWAKYKASLKKDKFVHILVLLGCIGILCILLSSCPAFQETTPETAQPEETQDTYRESLQTQLSELLSQMQGVGKTEVFVMVQGSSSYHYAQEYRMQKNPPLESVSLPVVTGVVVACEGGNHSSVQEMIYKTVSVACGVKSSQIYVTQLQA